MRSFSEKKRVNNLCTPVFFPTKCIDGKYDKFQKNSRKFQNKIARE